MDQLKLTGRFKKEWKKLDPGQKRYVMARQHSKTKAEAAREAGVNQHTVYKYDPVVEELVGVIADHRAVVVRDALDEAAVDAAKTLVDLLDSSMDSVRARVAEYIIDQTTGKATQKIEQETKQIESIEVEVINTSTGADE